MKKITSFISVILLGAVSLLFFFHTACTIQSTPVTVALVRTPTPTITPTPSNCPPVTLPPPGGSALVLYSNGTVTPDNASPVAFDTFSGGGDSNPTVSASGFDPLSNHTTEVSVGFNYISGGWTGLSLAPTTGTVDLSAFTTCTFWALGSQALSEGFDAAQPSSGCTNLVYENLTTCWQEFTIHIASSREDGCSGALTACIDYFVCSQAQSPGAGITSYTVYFDQVQFQ